MQKLIAVLLVLISVELTPALSLLAQNPASQWEDASECEEVIKKNIKLLLNEMKKDYEKGVYNKVTYANALYSALVLAIIDCEDVGIHFDNPLNNWTIKIRKAFNQKFLVNDINFKKDVIKNVLATGSRTHFEAAYVLWACVANQEVGNRDHAVRIQAFTNILFDEKKSTSNLTGWGYEGVLHADVTSAVTRSLIEASNKVKGVDEKAKDAIGYLESFLNTNRAPPSVIYKLGDDSSNPSNNAWAFNTLDLADNCTPEAKRMTDEFWQLVHNSTDLKRDKLEVLQKPPLGNNNSYSAIFAFEYTDYLRRNDKYLECQSNIIDAIIDLNITRKNALFYKAWKVRSLCNLVYLLRGPIVVATLKGSELSIHINENKAFKDSKILIHVKDLKSAFFSIPYDTFKKGNKYQMYFKMDLNGELWDSIINNNIPIVVELRGAKRIASRNVVISK